MNLPSPIQKIETSWSVNAQIELWIKREDLIHPFVSGNKFRKLKYNILKAKELGLTKILTFGGAFSNHIHATAAYGQLTGIETIGLIRGDELSAQNPTLSDAKNWGMQLEFISREAYRQKNNPDFLETLKKKYGAFYLVPEGGTNGLAVKGCEEILEEITFDYDLVCCAVGTGGTIAGLINKAPKNTKVLGFSALKGDFIKEEVAKLTIQKANYQIFTDYHFGGYAKTQIALWDFIHNFEAETKISIEPIYTGKMLFGLKDLCETGYFAPNTKIVTIHTGGLQGLRGFEIKK
jgi:1-aminocyclopropane-1-carboxylate deaminase